jgi:uncharacterized protein YgbK (DUF1537 family)
LRAVVALGPAAEAEADVLAIDLDMRERGGVEVRDATYAAAHALRDRRLYLKIDSTLRGPIGALVEGALEGSGRELAIVAPAFPEQGRALIGGKLRIDNMAGQSLAPLLGRGVARVSMLDEPEPMIEIWRARGARKMMMDARHGARLAELATAWQRHPEWLLVGSSGLARRIAPPPRAFVPPEAVDSDEPVLVIAGSPTEVTQRQVSAIEGQLDVLLLSTGASEARDGGERAQQLADRAYAIARAQRPRAIVLVGGQTGRAVCQRLGVTHVELTGELEPGVPIGNLNGGVWDGVTMVTKAGGFGSPNTLLDVVTMLMRS